MKSAFWQKQISYPLMGGLICFLTLCSAGFSYLFFTPQTPDLPQTATKRRLPEGSYPTTPLAVGAAAPKFSAADWINGSPPQPGEPGARLIVLDIWADW